MTTPWDSAYTNPLGYEQDGKEEVDPNSQAYIESARADYELCVHFAKIFAGKSGKEVLKFLQTVAKHPTWCTSFGSRDKSIDHGFAREGQNALVEQIEKRIEIGKACKNVEEYLDYITVKGK